MEGWAAIVTQLGVSGVLIIAWYLDRQQLKEERDYIKKLIADHRVEYNVLLERVIKGLHDAESAISSGVEGQAATGAILQTLRDMLIVKGSQ